MPIEVDDDLLVSFVLNRERRDFADGDLQLLDRVGPVLSRRFAALRAPARSAPAAAVPRDPTALALTPRERDVLDWLAFGKTDRDVGVILG